MFLSKLIYFSCFIILFIHEEENILRRTVTSGFVKLSDNPIRAEEAFKLSLEEIIKNETICIHNKCVIWNITCTPVSRDTFWIVG